MNPAEETLQRGLKQRAKLRYPAALAGSDIITMSFDILQQLYQHPLTDVVLDQFLKDWARIPVK